MFHRPLVSVSRPSFLNILAQLIVTRVSQADKLPICQLFQLSCVVSSLTEVSQPSRVPQTPFCCRLAVLTSVMLAVLLSFACGNRIPEQEKRGTILCRCRTNARTQPGESESGSFDWNVNEKPIKIQERRGNAGEQTGKRKECREAVNFADYILLSQSIPSSFEN